MGFDKNFVSNLPRHELETIYTISRIMVEEVEIISALERITRLTRDILIFDNIILYTFDNDDSTKPIYAEAIGRGKNEKYLLNSIKNISVKTKNHGATYLQYELDPTSTNRLDQRYYLGIPIFVENDIEGVLVFIRFGGPDFSEAHIQLAEFIGSHIGIFLQRMKFQKQISSLEARKQLFNLQDEFIAAVSHELNTPLGFIKGYTTTLLRENVDWDDQTVREFLTIIDEETNSLSDLIDNLLDSSRLQTGNFRVNPKPMKAEAFIGIVRKRMLDHYPHLKYEIIDETNEAYIKIDMKRITQVLDNLISNAEKYAPKKPIHIKFSTNNENFIIMVKDFGKGIQPKHIEHIFKRFYRIQENTIGIRGSGLGLFICKKIINAHNGEINVESVVNQGSEFTILLPLIDKNEYEAHEKNEEA